jgi:ferredoxin-NADP reductase/MOSC domain-containing protein YiiM/ferredoxin
MSMPAEMRQTSRNWQHHNDSTSQGPMASSSSISGNSKIPIRPGEFGAPLLGSVRHGASGRTPDTPGRDNCCRYKGYGGGVSTGSKSERVEPPQPGAEGAGKLLSVNVGKPKNVAWQGRTVFTGVYKDSVTGPCRVGKLNLDGDGQGDLSGHGGEQRAVFVYQMDSYRYWERELGRNDFVYGQFGENFTVEGLADDEVCVGDRYRIGSALFEVTQPRVTCYRVGLRMNDPRIPALLVSHRRPGFYFRVLEEGEVQAGDAIIKVSSGPEQMPVADVDALLYLPGHGRQQLLRALRIPALSPGWQASFRALLDQEPGGGNAGLGATSPPPAWPGFRPLTVTAITHESDSVISIRLEDPDGTALPPARPGQYLTLRVLPRKRQRSLLRNYSLSGPPGADYYRISVKRETRGAASGYLCTRLAIGDQLDIAAPRGTFILDQTDAPVLLVSAGIGATPVLAMLQALVQEDAAREIWWLHGARNGAEHSFAAEVQDLLASLPNTHSCVYYSRPAPNDVKGQGFDDAGRLTGTALAELEPPRDAEAYLCGPTSFMDEISASLSSLGIEASRIHTEPFGSAPSQAPGAVAAPTRPPHPPVGPAGTGPTIEFARSDLAIPWSESYASLLELAETCDVPVRWSCRTGVCQTCETTLIAGSVGYSPDPVEPPPDGSVLICCSQPRGAIVLDL